MYVCSSTSVFIFLYVFLYLLKVYPRVQEAQLQILQGGFRNYFWFLHGEHYIAQKNLVSGNNLVPLTISI